MRPQGPEHAPAPQSAARGPVHDLGGLRDALWDRIAPIIAELDRPQADGAAAHRRALNAVVFGGAAARAQVHTNTPEAPSYGW
jgi:hypothetical protein